MRSFLYLLIILLTIVSCKNTYTNNTADEIEVETIYIDEYTEPSSRLDSVDSDSTAISDIKFCISTNEFNSRKKTFLSTHPNLGTLKIASINGFFYNDSLAGIEIISVQQNAFRNNSNDFVGWEDLFKEKYRERYDFVTREYETYVKNIFVTDFSSQSTPSKTLKELMEKEYSILSYKAALPDIKFSDNVEGMMYTGFAFDNVKSSRGQQLYERMNREIAEVHDDYFSPTTPIYQRYYDQIREEANKNIQAHNNRIKDSPSWSIVRIIFKPLKDKYYEGIEENKKLQKSEHLKDTNII